MALNHKGLGLLIALCPLAGGALAQTAPPLAGLDKGGTWTLDAPKMKTTGRKKPGSAVRTPASSPEEADRAARLAEARRRFFAKPEDKTPGGPSSFGGYDADTMSGTFHPGATLKF